VRIGELSRVTGVSARSLRYYEQRGLISSRREANGYRYYEAAAIEAVELIQDLFAAGLPSVLLRDVIPCVADGGMHNAPPELLGHVQNARDRLVEQEQRLRSRRETLDDYLAGRATPRQRTTPVTDDLVPILGQP
jgi:MerR family redox-sensitive transcriptional activator SoxR